MTTTQTGGTASARSAPRNTGLRLPRYLDWIVAGALLLLGGAFALGGSALFLLADVRTIAELVESGAIRSDVLAGRALVETAYAVAWWGGIGLVAAGAMLWATAVGYLAVRRREEANRAVRGVGTNAAVGAVVSIVLSFVPFAPVLGGIAAGYLQRAGGSRQPPATAGGLSGLLVVAPAAVALALLSGGLLVDVAWALERGGVELLVGIVAAGLLLTALVTVAFGALGGIVGGRLAENRERRV